MSKIKKITILLFLFMCFSIKVFAIGSSTSIDGILKSSGSNSALGNTLNIKGDRVIGTGNTNLYCARKDGRLNKDSAANYTVTYRIRITGSTGQVWKYNYGNKTIEDKGSKWDLGFAMLSKIAQSGLGHGATTVDADATNPQKALWWMLGNRASSGLTSNPKEKSYGYLQYLLKDQVVFQKDNTRALTHWHLPTEKMSSQPGYINDIYNYAVNTNNCTVTDNTTNKKLDVKKTVGTSYIVGPIKWTWTKGTLEYKLQSGVSICDENGNATKITSNKDFYLKIPNTLKTISITGIQTDLSKKRHNVELWYLSTPTVYNTKENTYYQDLILVKDLGAVSPNTFTYTLVDTGSLTINKKDMNSTASLTGMEFTLKNSDGKYVKVSGGNYTGVSDSEVRINMGTSSTVTISQLPVGKYFIKEVTAPKGYELELQAAAENGVEANIFSSTNTTVNIGNQKYGKMIIEKIDSSIKNPIQGIGFKIAKIENGTKKYITNYTLGKPSKLKYGDENTANIFYTNENGKIILENIPVGTYYYEEDEQSMKDKKYIYIDKDGKMTVASGEYIVTGNPDKYDTYLSTLTNFFKSQNVIEKTVKSDKKDTEVIEIIIDELKNLIGEQELNNDYYNMSYSLFDNPGEVNNGDGEEIPKIKKISLNEAYLEIYSEGNKDNIIGLIESNKGTEINLENEKNKVGIYEEKDVEIKLEETGEDQNTNTIKITKADINSDGKVDFTDFEILSSYIKGETTATELPSKLQNKEVGDLDENGKIDDEDLNKLFDYVSMNVQPETNGIVIEENTEGTEAVTSKEITSVEILIYMKYLDVNNDGIINDDDKTCLEKIYAGEKDYIDQVNARIYKEWIEIIVEQLCSINKDDIINKLDELTVEQKKDKIKGMCQELEITDKQLIDKYAYQLIDGAASVIVENQKAGELDIVKRDSLSTEKPLKAGFKIFYEYEENNVTTRKYLKIKLNGKNDFEKKIENMSHVVISGVEYTTDITKATEVFTTDSDGKIKMYGTMMFVDNQHYIQETTSPEGNYELKAQDAYNNKVAFDKNGANEIWVYNTQTAELKIVKVDADDNMKTLGNVGFKIKSNDKYIRINTSDKLTGTIELLSIQYVTDESNATEFITDGKRNYKYK